MKKFIFLAILLSLVGVRAGARPPEKAGIVTFGEEKEIKKMEIPTPRALDLPQAKKELKERTDREGWKNKDGKRAVEVLEKLVEKGIPVEKALAVVTDAVEQDKSVRKLTGKNSIQKIKRKMAEDEIEKQSKSRGLKAKDVAVALDVLDELVEQGIPVEQARDAVKKAISEDRDPQELKETLTKERIREIKEKDKRKKEAEIMREKRAEERAQEQSERKQESEIGGGNPGRRGR